MAPTRILHQALNILIILFYYQSPSSLAADSTYNVNSYGANPDGETDCANAFLSAWDAACNATSAATIYVPTGRYLVSRTQFQGTLCKNNAITIRIDGTIVAPSDYNALAKADSWLKFERVTGVSILGGTLDGRGSKLWSCKSSSKSCPAGAASLVLSNSNNIVIKGLTSSNSEEVHVVVDGCKNINFDNVRISAPGNSPNTDGIHIQQSSEVTVTNSDIGTGDDCISIGPGASNLWIENIQCGPGHGISIGSLGWNLNEAGVQNVTVKTATFKGTQNGVRVKTWARPSSGFVRDVLFQHIVIVNAKNPILVDQSYCPNHQPCPTQGSGVKISGLTYQDIHGTSATKVAMKFNCSRQNPCNGITLDQVNLTYNNRAATASCANANGTKAGLVEPEGCF